MNRGKGSILGVISIKGGVGKTTTVVNLGASLVAKFDTSSLIIDGNLSAPNLGLHLGFIDPRITLHDVLQDSAPISQAIHVHDSGLHVIPASLSGTAANASKLKSKITPLTKQYKMILLDSAPSLEAEIKSVIHASDELLIISGLDFPTISATLRTIEVAEELNTPIRGVVLNRIRKKKSELRIAYVEATLETSVLAAIPEDSNVHESLARRMPVVLHAPNSPASKEFTKLAAYLIGERYEVGLWKRLREMLIEFLRR